MDSISFDVRGIPAPKGSVTKMPTGAYLPAGTAASRMNFGLWKENIASAARQEMQPRTPWAGPVRLMAEFQLPVPKSMPQRKWGWFPHVKRPDIDKLTRGLLDPLKGIVWVDDSQVCFLTINKVYGWGGTTGATIIIDFLTDDFMERHAAAHRNISNIMNSL